MMCLIEIIPGLWKLEVRFMQLAGLEMFTLVACRRASVMKDCGRPPGGPGLHRGEVRERTHKCNSSALYRRSGRLRGSEPEGPAAPAGHSPSFKALESGKGGREGGRGAGVKVCEAEPPRHLPQHTHTHSVGFQSQQWAVGGGSREARVPLAVWSLDRKSSTKFFFFHKKLHCSFSRK